MSYEPNLIIRAQDLKRLEGVLDDRQNAPLYYYDSGTVKVAEFLQEVIGSVPIEFEDSSFYICQPELTSFNADVREFLNEFDVYYKIHN